MKKLLVVLALCFSGTSFAAPYIYSDPDPTGAADLCVYSDGPNPAVETTVVTVPPALTGGCKIDTSVFVPGTHNLQVWFKSTMWGVETAKTPFVLQKPSAGNTGPQHLRLGQ